MELYNYGEYGVSVPMKVKEGNVTMVTGSDVGGDITLPAVASPAKKGDYVKIVADKTVEKCAASDTQVIGILETTPRWDGSQPSENKTWGNYEPRIATVQLFAHKVATIPLEAANSAISVGDSVTLGATTAQKWDKDATPNNTVALESAEASSGAKIAVAFGFYGKL